MNNFLSCFCSTSCKMNIKDCRFQDPERYIIPHIDLLNLSHSCPANRPFENAAAWNKGNVCSNDVTWVVNLPLPHISKFFLELLLNECAQYFEHLKLHSFLHVARMVRLQMKQVSPTIDKKNKKGRFQHALNLSCIYC